MKTPFLFKYLKMISFSRKNRISSFTLLQKIDEIYYLNNSLNPFTGFVEEITNEKLKVTTLKNGLLHGLSITYFKDGTIAFIQEYKYGQKNGEAKSYYLDGSLKEKATFKNGLLHGTVKIYFKNGKIVSKVKYNLGEIIK